jgi:hypothetical protein
MQLKSMAARMIRDHEYHQTGTVLPDWWEVFRVLQQDKNIWRQCGRM